MNVPGITQEDCNGQIVNIEHHGHKLLDVKIKFEKPKPTEGYAYLIEPHRYGKGTFNLNVPDNATNQLDFKFLPEDSSKYKAPYCVVKNGIMTITLEREYVDKSKV